MKAEGRPRWSSSRRWIVFLTAATVVVALSLGNALWLPLVGRFLATGDPLRPVDAEGIISSILYGPDSPTRIKPETRHAMFTVYAPSGIASEAVSVHLHGLRANVELVAPNSQVDLLHVYETE